MPYYYRKWWPRRRRFRRSWRRRLRGPFRRRYWRRHAVRRYSRKRKLPKLSLKEWQPITIRKTKVKGIYPAFLCNDQRLGNNAIQYLDSIAPHYFPGGGGFGIIQFTLQGLYEQFIKATNWWTQTNCSLPLIRYNFCKLKFYRTENVDYVVKIIRCYPLRATHDLYMQTQPSILMRDKHSILIPCRKNGRNRKPYKTVRVKPPTQMTNGWFFQKDLCNFPLLVILASAASFDRYYTNSKASSSTIGFISLNTLTFQYHDWQDPPTQGYKPQDNMWFWGTENGASDPKEEPLTNLIYLGGTNNHSKGIPVKNTQNYASLPNNWGNIFHEDYLFGTSQVYVSNKPPSEVVTYILAHQQQKVKDYTGITERTLPLTVECRYNPFNDKSTGNNTFFVSNHSDHTKWQPIDNPETQVPNLPIWLTTWGLMDWFKKAGIISQPELNYITVFESPYISSNPKLKYYVPLDDTMQIGQSPYIQTLSLSDSKHWYPKGAFQIKTLNTITSCGPGTVKLDADKSCEAHFEYDFRFKIGGCPPAMEKLCDPSKQNKYPIPNTKLQTTSLQSPASAIETYLYNFDERKGLLTERATKRIKKDYGTEQTILPFTGTAMDLPTPIQSPPQDQTSSEEEEETTQELQLLRLRRKQKLLKQRILQLLDIQNIE